MSVVSDFRSQVEQNDLKVVFDLAHQHPADVLGKLTKEAPEIFEPYNSILDDDESWIKAQWEALHERGYTWICGSQPAPLQKARTPLELEPMLVSMSNFPQGIYEALVTLSSRRDDGSGWNIGSRGGYGIKSILGTEDWVAIQADPKKFQTIFNNALREIGKFNPPQQSADEFFANLVQQNKWSLYPDLTVPFHLVWPQYFPAWYKSTDGGYSQIPGIDRLLDEIGDKLKLNRNELSLKQNYSDYAAAYRVLLLAYHDFISLVPQSTSVQHFDYLTQLLADVDPEAEATKLLRTKKAIVLYGVPGTSKTHTAKKIIAQSITSEERIHSIQFHPGYSYADFLIGIRPKSFGEQVTYPVVPGLLYRIAAEAALASRENGSPGTIPTESNHNGEGPENDPKTENNFVLVIDEINRADLAKVLGEAMFSLEYRGPSETIKLSYRLDTVTPERIVSVFDQHELVDPFKGGDSFYLPENLYIIGTMNHVDRSISGFDMAMRRRFAWARLDFSASQLREILRLRLGSKISNIELFVKRCRELNQWIEDGKSGPRGHKGDLPFQRDHVLGHTFLAEIHGILTHEQGATKICRFHLERLWLYHLQPQLEDALGYEANEYFDMMKELRLAFTAKL